MVCWGKPYNWNFLKAVFHNFYFVHSWILCPKYSHSGVFYSLNVLKMKKSFKKLCIVNSFVGEIEYYCPADLLKTFPAMNKTIFFFMNFQNIQSQICSNIFPLSWYCSWWILMFFWSSWYSSLEHAQNYFSSDFVLYEHIIQCLKDLERKLNGFLKISGNSSLCESVCKLSILC